MFDNTLTLGRFVVGCACLATLLIALYVLNQLGREAPPDGTTAKVAIVVESATIIVPDPALLNAAIDEAAKHAPEATWPPAAKTPVPPTFVEPLFRNEFHATPLPTLESGIEIPPKSQVEVTINPDGSIEYSEPKPINTGEDI